MESLRQKWRFVVFGPNGANLYGVKVIPIGDWGLTGGAAESVEIDEPMPADLEEAEAQPGARMAGERGLPRRLYVRVELDPVRAIPDLKSIHENLVKPLANSDDGDVTQTLEVQASSEGFDDREQRTVRENASQIAFDTPESEDWAA